MSAKQIAGGGRQVNDAMNEALGAYAAAWNEADAQKRERLLEKGFAPDGEYADPAGRANGRQELSTMIAGFLQTYPGSTIEVDSGIDEHDGYARFTWVAKDADGNAFLPGMDFASFAPDGRVAQIVGFFGPIPPAGA